MRFPKPLVWLAVALALFFPVGFGVTLVQNTRAGEAARRQLLVQMERGDFEAVSGPMPPKAHIISLAGGDLLGVVFRKTIDEQFHMLVSKLSKGRLEALILRAR